MRDTEIIEMPAADLLFSPSGCGAVLVDSCQSVFSPSVQRKFISLARALEADQQISEVVLGVNNLLVMFDPLVSSPSAIEQLIQSLWLYPDALPSAPQVVEIPVSYGGEAGEDLAMLAEHAGLSIDRWVDYHSNATYEVACVGSMPGFAYLTGLPAELAKPRRASPRAQLAKGSVIIGGAQAGVMPCTAPSGWHAIGRTDVDLFDIQRQQPCLLLPGDQVRFLVQEVAS
ncbi:5-oxoprolinase subunit PxpB [Pseudomonas sp. LB-090624]|uniref:5-oxoprolinase subunit PxpB n=1 Tax=Pseudomonas sp. LB-090624 TaxID=2213079 RepID=UPI0021156048|nr:5-oxoprolinase subunit PxpB [Pseudomonas sp. LB-090624]